MESYIVIEGKRIELPKDFVDNIKAQLDNNTFCSFVCSDIFTDTMSLKKPKFCEIGLSVVPPSLVGRCLILHKNYEWKIIDNPSSEFWTKLLVATKK